MAELTLCAIGHDLDVVVRMKRPDSAWRESVVIENPQCSKLDVLGVIVIAKREMPAAVGNVVSITVALGDNPIAGVNASVSMITKGD